MSHKGLNQLLCAALVDRNFRVDLLGDPVQSSRVGYLDHCFDISPAEERMLAGIKVERFEDFASQVWDWSQTQPVGELCGDQTLGQANRLPAYSLQPVVTCQSRV